MLKIKAVILCGGQGSRIRDVSEALPKPMLEIGGRPILWHIMKIYASFGIKDFVLCLGYRGWVIKDFFLNYYAKISDITVKLGKSDHVIYHRINSEVDWSVTMVQTGEDAQTGARIWNVRKYLEDCDMFSVTYGDGVADINISELISTHEKSKLSGTVSGVRPAGRFGELEVNENTVVQFNEKPNVGSGLINGGFMIFNKSAIKQYFKAGNDFVLERDVLPKMVTDRELSIYKHPGFWQCVDTPREYAVLNGMWNKGRAPWKVW